MHRPGAKAKLEYLLIHRPRYRDWSLPKGKLDADETPRAAARREVEEETGFRGELELDLGTVAYETRAANPKTVRYWMMEASDGKFKPNDEVDKVAWLPGKHALKKLTHPLDREVLRWARLSHSHSDAGRFYLVRHAQAGKRAKWKRPDIDRPISGLGRLQTRAVTKDLSGYPVAAILSSRYLRCTQTVAGLGQRLALDVDEHEALLEGASAKKVRALMRSLEARPTVLCTHGDVVEHVITRAVDDGAKLRGNKAKWPKGSTWILDTRDGKVVTARYLPPAERR